MGGQRMTITWYGHSNMFISAAGVSLIIDPFFEGNAFAPDWREAPRPEFILVTHGHGDHVGQTLELAARHGSTVCCTADMADWLAGQGLPREQIANYGSGWNIGGTIQEKGLTLSMTWAVHSSPQGGPVGFVVAFPHGPRVYHAGDTDLFGDMRLIGELYSPDLAMLPTGGVFTMDGGAAARACAWLGVRAAIPMHYKTFPALAQDTDKFVTALNLLAPACRALLPAPGESVTF